MYIGVREETTLTDRYERFMKCKTVAVFPQFEIIIITVFVKQIFTFNAKQH